jgi:hypothetical protein
MAVGRTDPTARVIFLLIRDNLPPGLVESAIERARAVQREVPDSTLGALACELAEKIDALVD